MEAFEGFKIPPAFFQSLFDASLGPCLVLLPDVPRFTIVEVNKAYTEATRTRREELIGHGLFDIFPDNPDDPSANGVKNLTSSLVQVRDTLKPHKMAIQKYDVPIPGTSLFEERYWSPLNTPLLDSEGRISYILHAVLDVTDQEIKNRELEAKVQERTLELASKNEGLLRQKEFVEIILDSSLILISVFDTNMRILTYNRSGEEVFGLKREEIIGRHYLDAFPGARDSLTHNSILRALQGETIHNSQYKSAINDRYYESYFVPLRDGQGEVYAVLMTAHDITGIVESAEQLRSANEELMRTNQELGQFAYVASHDLQEPLRKIQTFIGLLQGNLDNPELLTRYSDKIHGAATRMSTLIKDVLNYSGVSGRGEPFIKVDLNEVMENIMNDFELAFAEKDADVRYESLPVINGIPAQLHQLLLNLMSNALKFSDENPVIELSSRALSADEVKQSPLPDVDRTWHLLVFRDNGIGFEQQYAEKIFGIFQRLENRGAYSGTGIGLALCKKIVEHHGGYITAESQPGRGASFYIYLPEE